MIRINNKDKFNSFLWCIVIFIQYILLPLKLVISTTYFEYFVIFIVVILNFLVNGIRLDFVKITLGVTVLFIVDYLIFENIETFSFFYLNMFSSSLLIFLFTINLKNLKTFFDVYYKFSLLTLVSILLYFSLSKFSIGSSVSYMAIGNVLSFISIPLSFKLLTDGVRKKFNYLCMLLVLLLSLFFANRMSVVTIYLIFQLPRLFFKKNTEDLFKNYLSISFQSIVFIIGLMNIETIVKSINLLLRWSDASLYSLMKLERMLTDAGGFFEGLANSSSGRDDLYQIALNIIRDSYFLPNGISGFNYVGSSGITFYYPHNILLELMIVFGIFSIPIVIFAIIKFINKYNTSNKQLQILLLTFFIFSVSKSLVSSSIWLSPSLWVLIGCLYISNNDKYMSVNDL